MHFNIALRFRGTNLWIKESRQPETERFSIEEPGVELRVSLQQVREPEPQSGRLPRYLLPRVGYPGIEHVVEGVAQILAHDDGSVDGEPQVLERGAHDADDTLHAVQLLTQKDVQGLQVTHLSQAIFDL